MKPIIYSLLIFSLSIAQSFAQTTCNPIVVETTLDISGVFSCSTAICSNAMIITRGYENKDDGGGAEYVVVKNPGTTTVGIDFLICSNSSDDYYAMYNYKGSIIAEQAGLVGDGSTNNWDELKNLCAYLGSVNDAVLYLTPDKAYNIIANTPGTNYMTANFKMDGRGAKFLLQDATYITTLFYFNTYIENVAIRNVIFEGNPGATEDYNEHATFSNNWEVFRFNAGANDVTFDNVVFTKNYGSVTINNVSGNEMRFNNCDFIDNSMNLAAGRLNRLIIDNCLFDQENVLLNPTYSAHYKKYHHIYVYYANIYISNTKFNQKVGEAIKTIEASTLMLNNVEFDNAGRVYSEVDEVHMNNVSVRNTLRFLHLENTADCFINNLSYKGPMSTTTGLPIFVENVSDCKLFLSNALFEGSMKFYFNGFEEYSFQNVTIMNPHIASEFVFLINRPTTCDVKFDNVKVEIDQIPTDANHISHNDALFRIDHTTGYDVSLSVVNSQFMLSDALKDQVYLIRESGNEQVYFQNVGLKGFSYPFMMTSALQNNIRSEALYDMDTNEPHPIQYVNDQSSFLRTYLHKYVICTDDINMQLGDGAPNFHEIYIDPNGHNVSLTTQSPSTVTINNQSSPILLTTDPITLVRVGNNWFEK